MKADALETAAMLNRRSKNVSIKGPFGSVYADYRDSGKQTGNGPVSESARREQKYLPAIALTAGWDALETGVSVLTTVGSGVVKRFQDKDNNSVKETEKPIAVNVRTTYNRHLKPIRYGDFVMISAEISSAENGDLRHGLVSADPHLLERCRLRIFPDVSALGSVGLCVFRIEPPSCGFDKADSRGNGEILHYGKPFTLRSKFYGTDYICHDAANRADIETNFDKMGVAPKFLPDCIFTMVPKFQSRAKDCVYYCDDVLISSSQKGYFMHAGSFISSLGVGLDAADFDSCVDLEMNFARHREIESGSCLFQIAEYSSFREIPPNVLCAGTAVRLYQPELGAYLVGNCSTSPNHVFCGENKRHNSVVFCSNDSVLEIDPPVFSYDARNRSGGLHAFTEDLMGTGMFEIEKMNPLIGGALAWGEPVRFRHISTNAYLSANRAPQSGQATMNIPFGAALCRLLKPDDKLAKAQFYQDTLFIMEPASKPRDDDDRMISLPMPSVRIKHIYRQSDYAPMSIITDDSSESRNLPYFMRVRRRFDGKIRQLRADGLDKKKNESAIETILSFGEDVVLKIPQYPEIIASSSDEAASEAEKSQRVSELADRYTTMHKVAHFLDNVNDADVFQLILVPNREQAFAETGAVFVGILHDFEVSLMLLATKIKENIKYNVPRDLIRLVNGVLLSMHSYASQEAEYEVEKAFEEEPGNALQTAYDNKVWIKRQQQHIMDGGLLDRLFWLFRAPVYLGITWPVIYTNKAVLSVFNRIKQVITVVCKNNELVQEYVAHSSYLGSRTFGDDNNILSISGAGIGYASEIFAHLYVDEEGASRMLEAALSCNRELLSALFDEDVIESIVGLIQSQGAKPSLLRLLGSMANADSRPMFPNQRLLLDLLYSLRDDQRYILNRSRLLMETGNTVTTRPVTYGMGCTEALVIDQHNVCVLWSGSSSNSAVDSGALFQSANSLNLGSVALRESQISISEHLSSYFKQVDCSEGDRDWVSLPAIAWCIDPFNCFEFSKPGVDPKTAWSKRLQELKSDKAKCDKFKMMQKVVKYYGAILDFFERMTANRSTESINVLQSQFNTDLLFSGLGNEELPLFFRYRFGALLRNIYVDRFPHKDLGLPDLIRTPERINSVHSLDSALPTYVCSRKPVVDALGNISFPEVSKGFMCDASLTKFKRLQYIIGEYFLGGKYALNINQSYLLGSLPSQNPSNRLGASEVDSYRFSYVLLEIMHLLVRRGFYHSEGLLLQAIHIAYGVLGSHVYIKHTNIKETPDSFDVANYIESKQITTYEKLPTDDTAVNDSVPAVEMVAQGFLPSLTTDLFPFSGYVVSKVYDRIAHMASSENTAPKEHKVLSKSEDLVRLCSRHDQALSEASNNSNESSKGHVKNIKVFENQRHNGVKWAPVFSVHRAQFHSEDNDVRALFTTTTPEQSPDHGGGLPDDELWKWIDVWHVHPDAGVLSLDPEGWVYAFSWPDHGSQFSPVMAANSFVRRRKWERTRQLKNASEFADLLFSKDFSEPVILAAFKKNMNSFGVVNFNEVLHSIKEIAENERKKSKLLSTTRAVSAMDIEDEVFSELEIEKMLALYSKQCVMEALGMLSYIYTISADARVTSFFSIIRESILSNSPLWETKDSLDRGFAEETLSFTHRGQQLVERLFLGKLASLDCVQRSKGGCVEKFMGFIMNDDHEVCNLAIALLREHFQQVQKFADQMSNVIYCSGNYLYPHYLSARASIAVMSSHLEMYWIREDMAANAQKLIEIFDELTECLLCDSSGGVCHELQNVVRALKAHELALKTLQIDMSNHKMMTERQKDYCKPLWKSLCTFLCVFIRGNEINVSLLSSMIGGGHLRGIGVGFSGADSVVVLVATMISSSAKTLDLMSGQKLYVDIFEELLDRLYEIPNLHDYTSLLRCSLFNADGRYEISNQNFLIRAMLSKRYVNVLLLFVDENFEDSRSSIFFFKSRSRTMTADMGEISMDALTQIMNGNEYKERKLLMVQYLQLSFASQKRASGVYAAKLVHYHASCVELLAECAGGNNASNISKCLEILPFETVAAVLSEIDSCPCYPVLRAFAIFMVNVYILPPASDISQTDSVLDSPVLYEILTKICRVVAAVETMQWTQWSEGEGLRSFLFDGALSLFITFLFAETEILDSRKAEIATSVQRLIQHLQGIASEIFTDQEISKIDAVAQKIGMPMCNVPNQKSREEVIDKEAKFIVENPLKRQKSKKESQLKTAKRDHDESITWGDSNLRFSQLPYLLKTCPFISDLKDAEIDQFVNFILKTYQGDDDTESGGSTIDNDNTIDLLSEKASSRGEDKRPKESGTPSLSVRSKTARNNHQSKSNFVATVSRFIKFAREEIDVIVSKDEGDRNDIVRESLDKIKRANAYQAFNIAGSDMDELTAEHTKHSVHLISGNDDVSKNIPFVLKILARCIEHFAKKGILSEHGKTPRSMLSLSTNASSDLADVQDLFSAAMAPSLICEVIAGCRYTSVLSAAVELGIQLLTNGNINCQLQFLWHLRTVEPAEANKFFSFFRSVMLQSAAAFIKMRRERENSASTSKPTHAIDAIKSSRNLHEKYCIAELIEFLRLLNEGHNLEVQSILENQATLGLKESIPLLSSAVIMLEAYLPSTGCLHSLTKLDAALILQIFSFLAESVQGPCLVNQEILVKSSVPAIVQRLLDFTGHIDRRGDIKGPNFWRGKCGLDASTIKSLRIGGLQLLLSLLEGRQPSSVSIVDPVYAEMCNVFDYKSIPIKLLDIMDEKSSAISVLRRKFEKPKIIRKVENEILEEGFLLLSLGRELATHNEEVSMDLIPIPLPPVKRSMYASAAEAAEAERERRERDRIVKAFAEFATRLRSVEISWNNLGIFKFNFTLPAECRYLTEESKKAIIQGIDFGDEDRVKYFLQQTNSIHDDVSLQQMLQNKSIFILLMRFQDELDYATAFVAMCICFIVVISLQKGYLNGYDKPVYEPHSYRTIVQALAIIQLVILLYKLLQTCILTMPLIYKQNDRDCLEIRRAQGIANADVNRSSRDFLTSFGPFLIALIIGIAIAALIHERYNRVPHAIIGLLLLLVINRFIRAMDQLARSSWNVSIFNASKILTFTACMDHSELQYRVICAVIGILALDVDKPYYSSLLLLVIVKLSITLQNVVRAVTLPRVALFLSSVLGLIMIFIFAIFAFYLFPNEFYNEDQYTDECSTMLLCLTTFLHGGLLSGGGIADHISGDLGHPPQYADSSGYAARVSYDVFFFVIIIVLLLNIIFGIIIDTFGKLREDATEKRRLQNDYCFICGISKESFDAVSYEKRERHVASGFSSAFMAHIKIEHNMWDYAFFLIYLKSKNENNYFGIESYVANKIKMDDVSWIPRGKAISIPDTGEEEQHVAEERIIKQIRVIMDETQKVISSGLLEQTSRLQEENRGLREQVGTALRTVEALQGTLEEVKTAQISLEASISATQGKKK